MGLVAAACGSTAPTESEDAAPDVTSNAASTVEAETADTTETQTDTTLAPPVEQGESAEQIQPTETIEDPLFFGEFASLNGESVDLADFAGQDVVLWFWAPW